MIFIFRSIFDKKINLVFLFLILVLNVQIIHFRIEPNVGIPNKTQIHVLDKALNLSQSFPITEQISTLNMQTQPIELSSSIYHSFLLLKVQNLGDMLKKVTINMKFDQMEWEKEFRRIENLFEIHYDFSQETDFVFPLKDVYFDTLSNKMELNITLEYYPSVTGINAIFHIIDAKIRHIITLNPLDIQILPSEFRFNIPNTELFQNVHRMSLETFFISNLTENSKLSLTIQLKTDIIIESLELVGVTLFKGNFSEFTIHIDKNITKVGLRLKMREISSSGSSSSFSSNSDHYIQLEVLSREKLIHPTPFKFDSLKLPPHPIPAEIMLIVMPLVLFGVPLIVIYKQRDLETGERILKLK